MWRHLLVALIVCGSATLGSAETLDISRVRTITLCELTAEPAKNDQALVRVPGTYRVGFEAAFLEDRQCQDRRVWVEFAPTVKEATTQRVYRRWERAFDASATRRCDNVIHIPSFTLNVTFIARFTVSSRR